ncbi:MAG TPA: RNA polymerase factor sigma-54, partial [Burkholderiales bacterium]|nr:RNA polymerase factor sigma-54 [Burkholderiales bacterium]
MKHSLQLRLSQHLTLTPQLQQSIRLLQLSTLELNQELERFLQDNPLLERDEGVGEQVGIPPGLNGEPAPGERATEVNNASSDDNPAQPESDAFSGAQDAPYGSGGREDGDDDDYPQVAAESPTLRNHLIMQLSLKKLSERDRTLVTLLIESLDEDGYLSQDLAEIHTMLPEEIGVELEELQIALKHLQHFEPTGVGARNLGDCLALQLTALPDSTLFRAEALDVVRNHLEALASRD